MSGFEVVGAIAGVAGILTTTMDLYSAYKDIRGLPQAFLEVHDKIPLIINTLQLISTEALNATEDRRDIIVKVVKSCEEKAARLKLILEGLKLDGSKPFELERYVAVIRRWRKKGRVEDLLRKLLEDVRLLADNQTIHVVSEEHLKKLSEALDHLKTISPSAPDDMLETAAGTQVSHGGTGPQLNQFGENNTNNNNWGSGQFFAGGTHHHGPGK